MSYFTFLTREQIFDAIIGTTTFMTDFSVLSGGHVDEAHLTYYLYSSLDESFLTSHPYVFYVAGIRSVRNVSEYYGRGCPALPYSSIREVAKRSASRLEVEYGEYPQYVASKYLQDELENAYKFNLSSIKKTGKTYSTYYANDNSVRIINEYSFNDGKKYVRVEANIDYHGTKIINESKKESPCSDFRGSIDISYSRFKFSNGETYESGDYVWVKVQPIKWLIDIENDIALSKLILFAGDFRTNDLRNFVDRCFSKDIIPSILKETKPEEKEEEEKKADFENTVTNGDYEAKKEDITPSISKETKPEEKEEEKKTDFESTVTNGDYEAKKEDITPSISKETKPEEKEEEEKKADFESTVTNGDYEAKKEDITPSISKETKPEEKEEEEKKTDFESTVTNGDYEAKKKDDAEAKKMKYTLMREGLTLVKPETIEEWLQFVDNYSNNSYSVFIVKATISMMGKIEEGILFEKAEQQVYNEKLGLNNDMKYSIASALSHFSKQGEEYRKYWNKKYGIEEADEKGTVNPTVLFKEKK